MKSRRVLNDLFKDKTVKIAVGLIGTIIVFLGAIFVINPSLFKSILGFSGREFGIDTYKAIADNVPVYTSITEFNDAKATGFTNGTERAKLALNEVIAVDSVNTTKGYAEIRFLYLTGASVGIAGYGYVDLSKVVLVEKYNPCDNPEYAANNPQLCNIAQLVTVTFVQNNGKPDIKSTVAKGSTINSLLPDTPEKSGYDFAGWYTDAALTRPLDANAVVNNNVTLYAKWQAFTSNYTIKFDVNGGSPVPSNQTVKAGGYITRPTNPIKVDCRFVSWNYGDDPWNFTSMKVNDDTVSSTEVTLVAIYNCDSAPVETKHTVTFNTNRGVPSQNPIQVLDGGTVAEPRGVTLQGYTLKGWNNGNEPWDFANTITSSITLTAQWELNKPDITVTDSSGQPYKDGTWTKDNVTIRVNRTSLPTSGVLQYEAPTPGGYAWQTVSTTELVFPGGVPAGVNKEVLYGGFTLKYRVADNVAGTGNKVVSEELSIEINVDNQAPSTPTLSARLCPTSGTCTPENATAYTDGAWTNRGVFLYPTVAKFGSTDSHSGIAKTQISIDNSTWKDFNYTPTDITYYMYDTSFDTKRYIRTVDKAGNISPVKTYNIKVDKTTAAQLAALVDIKAYTGPKYDRNGKKVDNGGVEIKKGSDGTFTTYVSQGLFFDVGTKKTTYSPVYIIDHQYYDASEKKWSGYFDCKGDGVRPFRQRTGILVSTIKGSLVSGTTNKYRRKSQWRITNRAGTKSDVVSQDIHIIRDYGVDKRDLDFTAKCPIY